MIRLILATACLALASPAFAQTAGVAAQCKLLEGAWKETKAAGAPAPNDILVGCPGYESWTESMSRKDNTRAFRRAATSAVPEKARAYGKGGTILFQQMIARGVPPEIATGIVASPLFAKAAEAWGS